MMNTDFDSMYWPLIDALQRRGVQPIVGGGMALYLRDLHLSADGRNPNYPPRPTTRTTKDLDAFFAQGVIGDAGLFYQIPEVLHELDFTPIPSNEYWQWGALPDEAGYYTVMVDLLGPPIDDPALSKRPKDPRRVAPKPPDQSAGLVHARRTEEAAGIHHGPRTLHLGDGRSLQIASSLNLIILKLTALKDKITQLSSMLDAPGRDDTEQLAQKHAFDLLKVVSDMREDDWEAAAAQLGADSAKVYMQNASAARRALFDSEESAGFLVMRAHANFTPAWTACLAALREDLHALLP
jgi:hypothetical protein